MRGGVYQFYLFDPPIRLTVALALRVVKPGRGLLGRFGGDILHDGAAAPTETQFHARPQRRLPDSVEASLVLLRCRRDAVDTEPGRVPEVQFPHIDAFGDEADFVLVSPLGVDTGVRVAH